MASTEVNITNILAMRILYEETMAISQELKSQAMKMVLSAIQMKNKHHHQEIRKTYKKMTGWARVSLSSLRRIIATLAFFKSDVLKPCLIESLNRLLEGEEKLESEKRFNKIADRLLSRITKCLDILCIQLQDVHQDMDFMRKCLETMRYVALVTKSFPN